MPTQVHSPTADAVLRQTVWAATAPPATPTPRLETSVTADVCIVGAGYAGLSAALHLAAAGTRVVVLEAEIPGFGGSGRNGGQVIAGLKHDPREIEALFPADIANRLIPFVAGTADLVFDLIKTHRMDVPRSRAGWLQGATSRAGFEAVRQRAEDWARRGVAARILDAREAADISGAQGTYHGAWIDPRGGAIQPLAYVRGLLDAALKLGASVHGGSRVTAIERAGAKWKVQTAQGPQVTAERVVVCTNAMSDGLVPGLARSVLAPYSYQVATAPLSDTNRQTILAAGEVMSDTRNLNFYFRQNHEGRLLMGGRGPFRTAQGPRDWLHLERMIGQMFPDLGDIEITHRWSGQVAVTRDFLPHLHEPVPGMIVDIGCMGRGVGLQTAIGKAIAAYLTTGDERALPLPLKPIVPLPLHGLHKAYLATIIAWYRLKDARVA